MKISEIMHTEIKEINPDATIKNALEKMLQERVTSLIVNAKKRKNYGIITRKDIIHKIVAEEKNLEKTKVHEIMSTPLTTVTGEMNIKDCARIMKKCGLRHLPVVEDGRIIGMISNSDIFKAIEIK